MNYEDALGFYRLVVVENTSNHKNNTRLIIRTSLSMSFWEYYELDNNKKLIFGLKFGWVVSAAWSVWDSLNRNTCNVFIGPWVLGETGRSCGPIFSSLEHVYGEGSQLDEATRWFDVLKQKFDQVFGATPQLFARSPGKNLCGFSFWIPQ